MSKPRNRRWWYVAAAGAALATGAYYYFAAPSGVSSADVPTYTVQKGSLQINVLQGGEIRALKNFEVKSEIEYITKIISLIPEGYQVSEEDVREGKVLVELDASELKAKIVDHDIQFQTTVASYIEADENREIVKSENQSVVRETKNLALFALMDFEKYLGKVSSETLLKSRGLPESVESFDKHVANMEASAAMAPKSESLGGAPKELPLPRAKTVKPVITARTDFAALLDANVGADGEAQQKLRQLQDELLLHKSEVALAKQTVEASERLAAKGFINKSALENDQVSFEKVDLLVKTATTQLDLFKKYEFPKQCETFLAAYQEALHKLQRTIRENRSKFAQAESRFQTAKRRYDMELAKKEDLERQLKACVIKATQPGLVAYGPINASSSYRYNEPIEEGATVRFRQTILTIPDMTQMGAHVAIHESQVKKVKIGQRAIVRVDAEPDRQLEGTVAEVAVLPDSSSSRYTPTLKVYPSTIHIAGLQDWLKPGMNAKIEIVINQLDDIVYVPVQSIEVENDQHFCYVNSGASLERRPVKTGAFNDEFIEVKSGVSVGDAVALTIPKALSLEGAPEGAAPAPKKPGETKPQKDKSKADLAKS
ncbi:MAG: HlyD family efflux transporter periplasmic adaptor subunit [Verrucomicrobiaceae bacterium]|nr:HlyD family efflux transporter periplasmic adaptor subunit [Verrucomicrobiaceae bacterium]